MQCFSSSHEVQPRRGTDEVVSEDSVTHTAGILLFVEGPCPTSRTLAPWYHRAQAWAGGLRAPEYENFRLHFSSLAEALVGEDRNFPPAESHVGHRVKEGEERLSDAIKLIQEKRFSTFLGAGIRGIPGATPSCSQTVLVAR